MAPVVAGGPVTFTGMDPGVITVSGPNGLTVTLASQLGIRGAYTCGSRGRRDSLNRAESSRSGAPAARMSGSFTSTVEFSNPLLTWTNQSAAATIDKSQGLLVTWTGGNPGSYVVITGTSSAQNAAGVGPAAGFTCLAPVGDGRFTVPSYILLAMPTGPGGVVVQNSVYSSLSASGLDIGLALGDISIQGPAATYR